MMLHEFKSILEKKVEFIYIQNVNTFLGGNEIFPTSEEIEILKKNYNDFNLDSKYILIIKCEPYRSGKLVTPMFFIDKSVYLKNKRNSTIKLINNN